MNFLKKLSLILIIFTPKIALSVPIGIIAGGGVSGIIGIISIYRSFVPVDMKGALNLFSSCWSCGILSNIISVISNIGIIVYNNLSYIITTLSISITIIWILWRIFSGFFMGDKIDNVWSFSGDFIKQFIKLSIVVSVLTIPLPKLLTKTIIEPIFTIGLSFNKILSNNYNIEKCITSLIVDEIKINKTDKIEGIFTNKLQNNISCSIANIHKITGTGITVGWTMLNMAFSKDYMYKIYFIPIFPNILFFILGLIVMSLFFISFLPLPAYFLEIIIKIVIDFIMLPINLLSWLFKDWKIISFQGKNIKETFDTLIRDIISISLTCICYAFILNFLDTLFNDKGGLLNQAFENNDPSIILDSLMLRNESIITLIMMGMFMATFMISTPLIIKKLFGNFEISKNIYKTIEKNSKTLYQNVLKYYKKIKTKKNES